MEIGQSYSFFFTIHANNGNNCLMSRSGANPEDKELLERVVYSLLRPAVRLSMRFGLPLKSLTGWIRLAALHELRDQGLPLGEIAEVLGVSHRTVSRLSSQLKTNFFNPEREHDLPRQIEFALWSLPMSRAKLAQALPNVPAHAVDTALETLIEEGRAGLDPGRTPVYRAKLKRDRLVSADWRARVGAVNSLMATVTGTIYRRFFHSHPEPSLARTLKLRVQRHRQNELEAFYESTIWPFLASLDEDAEGDSDAIPVDYSVLWAPAESLFDTSPLERNEQ